MIWESSGGVATGFHGAISTGGLRGAKTCQEIFPFRPKIFTPRVWPIWLRVPTKRVRFPGLGARARHCRIWRRTALILGVHYTEHSQIQQKITKLR